ncbi:putative di- and tripeptidase DUG2 [Porphyridium purpureum]|uniref:Putative di-and tripeptidase DUG2 n=1 Tax=Porphyridium purpureum TaxID=35688 RepID=A0A5J4Z2I5_PORPP|nr:putative di- and tripeptidase DUG2 [Porphyridium purpureum]|eukprot:POR5150..scf208_2
MCRLLAYVGDIVTASELVLRPNRSIVRQSFSSRERISGDGWLPSALNGDGFGLLWYSLDLDQDPEPCVYKSTRPAWNDVNLEKIANKVRSRMIFAHVRAASAGMDVSENTCHPFQAGRFSFMHNGGIAAYTRVRRDIVQSLEGLAFDFAVEHGSSDSAVLFAVFLNEVMRLVGANKTPAQILRTALSPEEFRLVTEATLQTVYSILKTHGIEEVSLLNFVVTDGITTCATRFAIHPDPKTVTCASLYVAMGSKYEDCCPQRTGNYCVKHTSRHPSFAMISSEPLSDNLNDWIPAPAQSLILVTEAARDIFICPIVLYESSQKAANDDLSDRRGLGPSRFLIHECLEQAQRHQNADFSHAAKLQAHGLAAGTSSRSGVEALALQVNQSLPGRSYPDPDGGSKTAALGVESGNIYLRYEISTKENEIVFCMAEFENKYLIMGSQNGDIHIWDLEAQQMHTVLEHDNLRIPTSIFSLLVDPQRCILASASTSGVIKEWSIGSSFELIRTIECGQVGGIFALAYVRDGSIFYGCGDTYLRICSSEDSTLLSTYHANNPVQPLQPLPKGKRHPSINGFESWWEPLVRHGSDDVSSEMYHHSGVQGLALAENGALLCSACADGFLRVWDVESGKFQALLRGHRDAVTACVSIRSASNSASTASENRGPPLIVSASKDGTIRVWDVSKGFVCKSTLYGSGSEICCLAVAANDSFFVAGDASGVITQWCTDTCTVQRTFQTVGYSKVESVCVSSDSRVIFSSHTNGKVLAWEAKDLWSPVAEPCTPSTEADFDGALADSAVSDRTAQASHAGRNRVFSAKMAHQDRNRLLENALSEWVAFRSVSGSAHGLHRSGCWDAAEFIFNVLEELGATVRFENPAANRTFLPDAPSALASGTPDLQKDFLANPLVWAVFRAMQPNAPTVLVYGHYDCVSAQEREWYSDPWQMSARDGHFYGRGVTDNKGPILAMAFAFMELLQEFRAIRDNTTNEEQPQYSSDGVEHCPERVLTHNVIFAIEGHGEGSNEGFREMIARELVDGVDRELLLNCKLVMKSNSYWIGAEQPCITYGMRGVLDLEISVSGPNCNLHAGVDGGAMLEPVTDLCIVLASLKDSRGNINIPFFHEDVKDLSADERALFERVDFRAEDFMQSTGVSKLISSNSLEVLEARWAKPSLSITSVVTSNMTKVFSVLPKSATARISVRLVPDQDPDKILELIKRYLEYEFGKLHSGNQVSIKCMNKGKWWLGNLHDEYYTAVSAAIQHVWQQEPLFVREGGTLGLTSFFEETLKCPVIQIPLGANTDNAHLANERIRAINLFNGRDVWKDFMARILINPDIDRAGLDRQNSKRSVAIAATAPT